MTGGSFPPFVQSYAAVRRGWLGQVLQPVFGRFGELLGISLFINILALAVPVFVLQVYDRVVLYAGMSTLQGLTLGVVMAVAFDFVLRQSRARVLQRVSLRVDADVGHRLFTKLSRLPMRALERQSAAGWEALHRDAETLRNTLGGPPMLLTLDLPFALLFVGVIALIALPTLPVIGIAIACFMALGVFSARRVSHVSRAEVEGAVARNALLTEMIAGRTTCKALDMGASLQRRLEDRHAHAIEGALRRGMVADGFANLSHSLAMLTTVGMTVVGALAILAQEMTIGSLIAANMLASRITGPCSQLVPSWRAWTNTWRAVERFGALFALSDDRSTSGIALPRPAGKLVTESVSFRYNDSGEPVIRDLSLKLDHGLHGLIGASGAGKTTVLKLLRGLYPPFAGRVLLDGADLEQFCPADLARWIGYVPQDPILLEGSIRDNITGFDPDVADERIVHAAKLAGVHDFIVDLPSGYATDVGEGGGRLSGGQRQRLAIARALLNDPQVHLLDEPTASLDLTAEQYLRDVLRRLAANRTIVAVTHSPVLLGACDTLIVLDRGRVAAQGAPATVAPNHFAAHGSTEPHSPKKQRHPPAEKFDPTATVERDQAE